MDKNKRKNAFLEETTVEVTRKHKKNNTVMKENEPSSHSSSEEDSSVYDDSEYSSDLIEFEILTASSDAKEEDIKFVIDQCKIFVSHDSASLFSNPYLIKSDELVLGITQFVELTCFNKFITKGFKKVLNSFNEKNVLFSERIANVPLNIVLSLYKKLDVPENGFLFISRINRVDKIETEEVMRTFSEYEKEDMGWLPIRPEEILLLGCNDAMRYTEVNNMHFRIFKLDSSNFASFIKLLENEIKKE